MFVRKASKALTHANLRDLDDAAHFADRRGKLLTTSATVHPACLDDPPSDIGRWVSTFLNKLRIWCTRAGFGYYAIWVRENYEGAGREHLHVLLSVPVQKRPALEAVLIGWLPGKNEVVKVGLAKFKAERSGRRVNQALTYIMKQMTPQACYSLDNKVRREKHSRFDGSPVAPVLGKRCGVSRSLSEKARQEFWQPVPSGR